MAPAGGIWSQTRPVERHRRIDAMSIAFDLARVTKKGLGSLKAGKVDVATIHDVDGSGFRQEHGVEGMNVVQLAIRDVRCG